MDGDVAGREKFRTGIGILRRFLEYIRRGIEVALESTYPRKELMSSLTQQLPSTRFMVIPRPTGQSTI